MRLAICRVLQAYSLVIIARILLEWIQVPFDHPVAKVRRVFRMVTDPVLVPVRRLIPPVRTGGMAIDLSPVVVVVVLSIVAAAIC